MQHCRSSSGLGAGMEIEGVGWRRSWREGVMKGNSDGGQSAATTLVLPRLYVCPVIATGYAYNSKRNAMQTSYKNNPSNKN